MDRQLVAVLDGTDDLVDVGDDEPRVDPLAEEVQRQGHDIDIAGALAIAEERAFDPLRTGHHRQLGRGDRRPAVVVRVHAQGDAVAVADVPAEPLDLIGVNIGRRHLDGRRKIEDGLLLRRRLPDVHHRLADLDGKVELGPGKAFGRVLINDLAFGHRSGEFPNELGAIDGDVYDPGLVEAEDDPALQGGGRVVEVHDGAAGAADRLEAALDQLGPGLGQNLDRDIVRDEVAVRSVRAQT